MSLPFSLSYAALWVLVVVQGLILLGVVRLVYQIQQGGVAVEYSQQGREVPEFSVVDLAGMPITNANLVGRTTALLFVSPSCHSCKTTLAELDGLQHKTGGNVIVICRARRDDCARLQEEYGLGVPTVVDEDDGISRLLGVTANPMAVLVDAQGRIQSYGQPMRGEELVAMFGDETEAEDQRGGPYGDGEHRRDRASGLETG